jgi:hypothetical protein
MAALPKNWETKDFASRIFLGNLSFSLQSKKALRIFDGRNRPFRVCACVVR